MIAESPLFSGLVNVFSWPGILIPVAGTLMAMVGSFLPGLGNTSIAVFALILTVSWDPTSALLLFGAMVGGATFMGSITAILFNVPGNVSSTPALLDGYPLGQRGFRATAIAAAATASALGSLFGVIALLLVIPVFEPLLLKVGPLEIFVIAALGLMVVTAIPAQNKFKTALMVFLGLSASMIGMDPMYSEARWTLGFTELQDGLGIIPMMLGVFTVAEAMSWLDRQSETAPAPVRRAARSDSTLRGILSVIKHWRLTLRASLIGTWIGMIPGIGGIVSGFVAYGHAMQTTPNPSKPFGSGQMRGLIAPEAAVDSKDGGSLLPTLAFGLPGSEASVLLLAVFAIHGLVPGVDMLTTHLDLTYTLVFALLFSNILTSVCGVLWSPWLARLGLLKLERVAIPVLLICVLSVLQIRGAMIDVYIMLVFGVLSYLWGLGGWPKLPFVIAFVLGEVLESNYSVSVQLIALDRIDSLYALGLIAGLGAVMVISATRSVTRARATQQCTPSLNQDPKAYGMHLAMLLLAAYFMHGVWFPVTWAEAFPMAVASILWLLCVGSLMKTWTRTPSAGGLQAQCSGSLNVWTRLGIAWVLGLGLGFMGIGLVAASALGIGWWLRSQGLRPIAWVSITAILTVGLYYLVDQILNLILPEPWIWNLM